MPRTDAARFDPELYLRLLGERELVSAEQGRNHRPDGGPVLEAARALVAVGAIERDLAAAVIDGYGLATGLRSGHGMWGHRVKLARASNAGPAPAPAPPEPPRIVVCDAKLERPAEEISISAVTLSKTETRFTVRIRALAPAGARAHQMRAARRPPLKAMFNYTVVDDQGTRAGTEFTGGGNDTEWRGRLNTDRPLAVDTAWIEFDGTRMDLVDVPNPCTVSVEPVPRGDPGASYVWFWLACGDRHGRGDPGPVLDALVAAGSLGADDPQVEAVRVASEAHHPWGPPSAGRPSGLTDAPLEWRSYLQLRRGRLYATGAVALSAVTPAFDGTTVIFSDLEADQNGWEVQFDATGGIAHGPFDPSLGDGRIAWWAVDDLDQHYLGQAGSWSGGPGQASGTLNFQPGIDRDAKALTLLPTGPTERARLTFPLAWGPR